MAPSFTELSAVLQSQRTAYMVEKGSFLCEDNRPLQIRFNAMPSAEQVPQHHPGWPLVVSAIRQGKRELDTKDISLIVLFVPMKIRVLGHYIRFEEDLRPLNETNWEIPEPLTMAAALATMCDDLEIPFIDATAPLRNATAAGGLTYLPFDSHLTDLGHDRVAQLLVKEIERVIEEKQ